MVFATDQIIVTRNCEAVAWPGIAEAADDRGPQTLPTFTTRTQSARI